MKHPISQLVLLIGVALFGMHASAGEGSCDPGIAKKAFAKCASCHTAGTHDTQPGPGQDLQGTSSLPTNLGDLAGEH